MKLILTGSTNARDDLEFLMIDSSDHISPKTGLTPTVTIRKAGGSFASPSGAVSEIANGWYKVAANGTDNNTNGLLILHATATGADPSDERFLVVATNLVNDAVRGGFTALPNANAEAAGGLFTRGTGAGQINQPANGMIDGNVVRWLGTAAATPATAGIPKVAIEAAGDFAQGAADKSWSTAARTLTAFSFSVTVGTNNDKTGYTLSSAGIQAVWDALTANLTTASSIGKLLVDNVNATISSRMATFTLPANFASFAITAGGAVTVGTLNAAVIDSASLATSGKNAIADSLLDRASAIDGSTPRQAIQWIAAVAMGKVSGMGTNAPVFLGIDGVTTRVSATTDANGNRTAVTLS